MTALDVLVIGEPLVELSAASPLDIADTFSLSFSGDALNSAAAAAAAGARTSILTRVGDDEVSRRLLRYMQTLDIDTRHVIVGAEHTGAYLVGADPDGTRDFVYLRSDSAASRLSPSDLEAVSLPDVKVLLVSGITMAISESAGEAILRAVREVSAAGGRVIYDPNFRRRLTTVERAREAFAAIAPHCHLVLPSCPSDSTALLGTADPQHAAERALAWGAANVCVTQGADGVLFHDGTTATHIAPSPAPHVVDATGAGDVFAGTLAACLSRGPLGIEAITLAGAAAALSLQGQGGTGHLPTLSESRKHVASHHDAG
ncbi:MULTISPECIES: sugar kinase [Microbacterium]|uniref:Sugar kinase n=1 Tax=Microbacterium wangchenii TaxID=2541726 RepID=A0ABX5SRV7_9MICO|nr:MULTISPECIES: sugar kinase [Microbacterium]MCK6065442.1 sugar kinase [Microbacterium sp. EYE_512]QBR88874.1 sugar kinase [Microbacterium wangchenii]